MKILILKTLILKTSDAPINNPQNPIISFEHAEF